MTEVMVDILGRATCTYSVDSDTYLSLSQLMLPKAGGYVCFEGFALKWDKTDGVNLRRSPHT